MKSKSQSGVALVITLLMLSVITFLAVAFLAVSNRDRKSVGMALTQRDARGMADAALQRAQSEIISRALSITNSAGIPLSPNTNTPGLPETLNYDLMVSRNYINPKGFVPSVNATIAVTNVSYQYANGTPVANNPDDLAQVVANLFYDPRPPVFVSINSTNVDFRFWVDLNRNGRFETNGRTVAIDDKGAPIVVKGITNYVNYAAEPEWIGMLRNPEFPHSRTNPFVGRYAYLVAPIGKTLDWNYIHNFAQNPAMSSAGFRRNQGFGSWEINLAGLLASADANYWLYSYTTNALPQNSFAFADAKSFLTYRYNGGGAFSGAANLDSAKATLGPSNNFSNDGIDNYADGPLQTTVKPGTDNDNMFANSPWSGSDNPKAYYDPEELFDTNKTSSAFVNRLLGASTRTNSYDRYTFARLLATIGTGSEPELTVDIFAGTNSVFGTNTWDRRTKVNLNYDNTEQIVKGLNTSQTAYRPWHALNFFTNAADLILRSQYADNTNYTITNLWIYSSTNRWISYSAKLHRCLQLAANLYDASTNANDNLPSVFRPLCKSVTTNGVINVYIIGFEEVTNNATNLISRGFQPFSDKITTNDNIWGVPWVVGAKKGLPNFNECSFSNTITIGRKLQFRKSNAGGPPVLTNQMYVFGMSNYTGIEVWNSYKSNWNRNVRVIITNEVRIMMTTNGSNGVVYPSGYTGYTNWFNRMVPATRLASSNWLRGFNNPDKPDATNSFWIPLQTNALVFSNYYRFDEKDGFVPTTGDSDDGSYANTGALPFHDFGLKLTNRFVYAMIDDASGRLIDFVNFGEIGTTTNLIAGARDLFNDAGKANPWGTNNFGMQGITNQIMLALGSNYLEEKFWNTKMNAGSATSSNATQAISFRNWWYGNDGSKNLRMASPYQPLATLTLIFSSEVNDPLVHYTRDDLTDPQHPSLNSVGSMGTENGRALAWGGKVGKDEDTHDATYHNMTFADPNVLRSDDWDFPTNKYPNVGWIGRVHRGTPWQTIFLKADPASTNNVQNWTNLWAGSANSRTHKSIIADTYPTNDWVLPDLFTVAPNDNAARGTLSVNQTNLAAWSAIFSGVIALQTTNTTHVIDPTNDVPLLVDGPKGINSIRNEVIFHKTGAILAAPALTTSSPFLAGSPADRKDVTDAVVERIPQQTLSLLKVGQPRFVIWAYGQSLKPQSLYMGSKAEYFGLCTNYQITGESLTRTVCRLEYGNSTNTVPRIVVESFNVVPGDQ